MSAVRSDWLSRLDAAVERLTDDLATVDVRQHASVHRDVVGQGLARDDWQAATPANRSAVMCEAITRDRGGQRTQGGACRHDHGRGGGRAGEGVHRVEDTRGAQRAIDDGVAHTL